jgi:DNA-binding transcriptional MocR family regulator
LVSASTAADGLDAGLDGWADRPGPLYQRLADALRDALDLGIPAGTALPAERQLALQLAISRTTVVAAYRILRAEGRLISRQGSGTRVAGPARPARARLATKARHDAATPRHATGRPARPASAVGFRSLIGRDEAAVDLATAGVGADGVLTAGLLADAQAELLRLAAGAVGYFPQGLPSLRRAIARHLTERGVATSEQQILVTNGAQQAIALLARRYASPGTTVAMENPTYAGALDAFAGAGARFVSFPAAEDGDPGPALQALVRRQRPRLLYLMPTFHNPTGLVATAETRRQLAALAAEHGLPLVEDNTLEPLAVGAPPPPPVAAFDSGGTVITIGSLSKVAWAGLRIAWIRAGPRLIAELMKVKAAEDLGSSVPSQVLGRAVLDDFPRISGLRSAQVCECLQRAARLLGEQLPAWRFRQPAGGHSLWLRLPGADASAFAATAMRHGVTVIPGPQLSPDGSFADHIRLQFLQPPGVLEAGIQRLAAAWADYTRAADRELEVIV